MAGAHVHAIMEEHQEPHLHCSMQGSKDADTIPLHEEYIEA